MLRSRRGAGSEGKILSLEVESCRIAGAPMWRADSVLKLHTIERARLTVPPWSARLPRTLFPTSKVPARFWQRHLAAPFAAVLSSSLSAVAEEPLHVSLDYNAPATAGCPGEFEFRSAVVDLLEYDPFVPDAARSVSVEISATDGILEGFLRWRDQEGVLEGERAFASFNADCTDLAKNMAFAVTVQLQLLNAPRSDSPAPEGRPEQPENPPQMTTVPSRPELPKTSESAPSATPATRRFEMGAGAGLFVTFGWAPSLVAGGSAFVVGRGPNLSGQLGFETILPERAVRDNGSGFETSILAASFVPCMRLRSIEACSIIRFGQVRIQGFGVDEPRTPRAPFSQAGLRLGLAQALGAGVEAKTHAEVVCTLAPWKVQLNGSETFAAPLFVFLMGFDLAAFFP